MPIYSYIHKSNEAAEKCSKGLTFDLKQPLDDLPLRRCPYCGEAVERQVGSTIVQSKKFNSELRDLGFTKLVRVDDGIFENVTRRNNEERYIDRRNPETFPDFNKTIKD